MSEGYSHPPGSTRQRVTSYTQMLSILLKIEMEDDAGPERCDEVMYGVMDAIIHHICKKHGHKWAYKFLDIYLDAVGKTLMDQHPLKEISDGAIEKARRSVERARKGKGGPAEV